MADPEPVDGHHQRTRGLCTCWGPQGARDAGKSDVGRACAACVLALAYDRNHTACMADAMHSQSSSKKNSNEPVLEVVAQALIMNGCKARQASCWAVCSVLGAPALQGRMQPVRPLETTSARQSEWIYRVTPVLDARLRAVVERCQ
jgi:hypothetical protein